MAFSLPPLVANAAGWGPPAAIQTDLLPAALKDLPYQPFSKSERISKVADWTVPIRPQNARRDHVAGPAGFTFTEADEDDSEFRLVDSRTSGRTKLNRFARRGGGRPGGGFRQHTQPYGQQRHQQGQPGGRGRQPAHRGGSFQQRGGRMGHQGHGGRQQYGGGGGYYARRMGDSRRFDASINVNPEWGDPIETYEFPKLTKIKETVTYPDASVSEVLFECGKVGIYNAEFGRSITTKTAKTLLRNFATERTFLKPTSSEDPNLRKFAADGVGNVFVTDSILSALMAAPRAVYSWDLVVTKKDGQIWIDRRTSRFDAVTVNENSSDPPDNNETDPLNTPSRLSQEAVACQQNFSQQVLTKGQFHTFEASSPFSSESANLAPIGYRYSVMPVGDKYKIVVRAEIDAVKPLADGDVQHISVKTLNEFDPKVTGDWRKRIDIQRAGVLANELKNNMFKIQRWAVQALFAGASKLELGYLSRQHPNDAAVHIILSVQSYTPQAFFTGMAVNLNQMWSIVHLILERISAEDDGKYLIYKEAGITNLKIYKIPQAAAVQTETTAETIGATTGLQILK